MSTTLGSARPSVVMAMSFLRARPTDFAKTTRRILRQRAAQQRESVVNALRPRARRGIVESHHEIGARRQARDASRSPSQGFRLSESEITQKSWPSGAPSRAAAASMAEIPGRTGCRERATAGSRSPRHRAPPPPWRRCGDRRPTPRTSVPLAARRSASSARGRSRRDCRWRCAFWPGVTGNARHIGRHSAMISCASAQSLFARPMCAKRASPGPRPMMVRRPLTGSRARGLRAHGRRPCPGTRTRREIGAGIVAAFPSSAHDLLDPRIVPRST